MARPFPLGLMQSLLPPFSPSFNSLLLFLFFSPEDPVLLPPENLTISPDKKWRTCFALRLIHLLVSFSPKYSPGRPPLQVLLQLSDLPPSHLPDEDGISSYCGSSKPTFAMVRFPRRRKILLKVALSRMGTSFMFF